MNQSNRREIKRLAARLMTLAVEVDEILNTLGAYMAPAENDEDFELWQVAEDLEHLSRRATEFANQS